MSLMRTPLFTAVIVCGTMAACKPSDILSVPPPTGVVTSASYASQGGAELLEDNGFTLLSAAYAQESNGAIIEWTGMLADEFQYSEFVYYGDDAGPDLRLTEGIHGFAEPGDNPIEYLMRARVTLLTALPYLQQYEPASGRSKIGLAYALIGYTELFAAENYCAGLPLGELTASGVQYGTPLSSDSVLGVAEADFNSAVANANGDATVLPLANIGLARTRLDRGNFTQAASSLSAVPTSFVYTAQLEPGGYNSGGLTMSNVWQYAIAEDGCGEFTGVGSKGENGLNYTTANDPRLVFSTSVGPTCDYDYGGLSDSVWYVPVKFQNATSAIPLETGVQARLIEAEAALAQGQVGVWAADLNALRANAPSTYLQLTSGLPPLTVDSTLGASSAEQVSVMFRERAFWLYGLGNRLSDLRRLVRQYGRNENTVYSVGPYPFGSRSTLPSSVPNYLTDVVFTLPTSAGPADPNSNFKGCLNKSA
jgi:starch-binding outer membrane protein, SusD/RagB family